MALVMLAASHGDDEAGARIVALAEAILGMEAVRVDLEDEAPADVPKPGPRSYPTPGNGWRSESA